MVPVRRGSGVSFDAECYHGSQIMKVTNGLTNKQNPRFVGVTFVDSGEPASGITSVTGLWCRWRGRGGLAGLSRIVSVLSRWTGFVNTCSL
jgi:hypothetical protein